MGGNPGLVVIGDDSCSKGRGFKSRRCILDGHFFTLICCKNCSNVCLKIPKINEKEAGYGPFLKNQFFHIGLDKCGIIGSGNVMSTSKNELDVRK